MNSFNIIKNVHVIVVMLFLLIYLAKTILLLMNNNEGLAKLTKMVKIPEMIISFTFLITGVYLLTQLPEINTLMIIKIICVLASIPLAIIGFKKTNKLLAALSLLLIIGSYGLAEISAKKKNKAENTTASFDGKEIYTTYCVKCHGDEGNSQIMGATDLTLSQMEPTSVIELLTNGNNSMPAFSDQLTPEQLTAVSVYIKTLRK